MNGSGNVRWAKLCLAALLLLLVAPAVLAATARSILHGRESPLPIAARLFPSKSAQHTQLLYISDADGTDCGMGHWFGAAALGSEKDDWIDKLRTRRRRPGARDVHEHGAHGARPVANAQGVGEDKDEEDDEVETLLGKRRLKTADDSGDDNGGNDDCDNPDTSTSADEQAGTFIGHGRGDGEGDDDDDDDNDDEEPDYDNDASDSDSDDDGEDKHTKTLTQGERLILRVLIESARDNESQHEKENDGLPNRNEKEAETNTYLKQIWKRHVFEWTPTKLAAEKQNSKEMIHQPASLPAVNTSVLFWNCLEAMENPEKVPADKAWIARSTVSQLKGTALLCHEPALARHASKLPRPPRGIRLVTPRATHSMQRALSLALATSVGAKHVSLDEDTLEEVRKQAIEDGIPEEMLSKHTLLSVLLDLAEEEHDPYVITLCDKGSSVLNSEAASEVILDEMTNPSSRVFFVMTSVTANVTEAGVQTATIAPIAEQQAPRVIPEGMPVNTTARFRIGMPPPTVFSMLSQRFMRDFLAKKRQEEASSKDKEASKDSKKSADTPPPEGQYGASHDSAEGKDESDGLNMLSFPIIFSDPTGTNRFPIPMIPLHALLDQDRFPSPEELARQRRKAQAEQKPVRTSADALSSLFENVVVPPPQDPKVRAQWEKVLVADAQHLICRRNSMLLGRAMDLNAVSIRGGLESVKQCLSWRVLTDEQIDKILLTALKVEASRSPTGLSLTTKDEPTWEILPETVEVAIRDVCGGGIPASPKASTVRTKEEIDALIQDKQERGLLSNIISPQDIGVTYDMIGGLNDVKELLRQFVTYPLKYSHLYREGIAAEAVKGVLLFGPPGTGKTMLAKAVATEGGATFLSIDASTIESKWLGESEKNARAVFTLARKLAPCVIYIDEVDSVLSSRERGDDSSHGTLTSVKTTIMQEWDGLRTTSDRVLVIASTNRPYDLDEAVLRRLPRRIMVDLPDRDTRRAVLEVSMAGNRVSPDVNFTAIADRLEGYTGSDIKEICREAVVRIAHEQAQKYEHGSAVDSSEVLRPITIEDFDYAISRLQASVNQEGRELSRVWEWNEKFGEIKKKKPRSQFSMYL